MQPKNHLKPLEFFEPQAHQKISFYGSLPDYLPPESIGLNDSKINKVLRLGRLSHLAITLWSGEVSQYQADINNLNNDGTATMGRKTIATRLDISSGYINQSTNNVS